MIIDSHFHLEQDLMSVDNMLSAMDINQIDQTALIASICHGLSEPSPIMLKVLRRALFHSFFRNFVKPICTRFTPDGHVRLPGSITSIYQDPDNTPVFEVVDEHPDRFLAWVFVNPRGQKNAVEEFDKWRDHPGCIGVKVHPYWHRYRPVDLKEVAQCAANAGKPMLMHAGFDDYGDVIALATAVPDLKLVLAHAGFPAYGDVWHKIKELSNIVVDLSATAYVDEAITRKVVAFLGVERCIYGTDGPFGSNEAKGAFDYGYIKNRLKRLFPDEAVQAKLFYDNFKKLTGIKA